MNARTRQYLFGLIFIGVGIYYALNRDYLELCLYGFAGIAFVANALTMEPALARFKKPMVIISWLLIITTGILFLYMLQFKYL
jgi:hypothetical protein